MSWQPGNAAATISAISRTRWLASLRPTLKTSLCTASRGAVTAARMASQMSPTCTIGRHGLPSEVMLITPVVQAKPDRLFSTMSKRIRGDGP